MSWALEENSDGPPDDMPRVHAMNSTKFEEFPTKKKNRSSEQICNLFSFLNYIFTKKIKTK